MFRLSHFKVINIIQIFLFTSSLVLIFYSSSGVEKKMIEGVTSISLRSGLFGDNARRFRLHVLNMFVVGHIAHHVPWYVAMGIAMKEGDDTKEMEDAVEMVQYIAGYEAWCAVKDVVKDVVMNVTQSVAWNIAMDVTGDFTIAAIAASTSESSLQIVFNNCRSTIAGRKEIFCRIDALGDKISSTSMTIDEVVKCCRIMMTCTLEKLKPTIPLKMLDYLLGYERAISFLNNQHYSYRELMNKHAQLVQRLGLETRYAKLTAPCINVKSLAVNYLSMLPRVLVEIIIDYCRLTQDDPEESDEIRKSRI